jgi:hypothetical protein
VCSLLSNQIPFEIHITISALSTETRAAFEDFCHKNNVKPLLIELSQGETISQPMLSKLTYATALADILLKANHLTYLLQADGFVVKRLKMEVPFNQHTRFAKQSSTFLKYFEWHGKVKYTNVAALYSLCEKHKAHLSVNALTNRTDERFITLREFGPANLFQQRIIEICRQLTEGGWGIIKQESEYCIYDNNTHLDNGWLPQ